MEPESTNTRSKLTLTRKVAATPPDMAVATFERRPKKRVIIVPPKPEKKPKPKNKRKPPRPPAKPKIAASVAKGKTLDDFIREKSPAWRNFEPLTRDGSFEKTVRRLCQEFHVYTSKVLLAKVIKAHKQNKLYMAKVMSGGTRKGFNGEPLETISKGEQSDAAQRLTAALQTRA